MDDHQTGNASRLVDAGGAVMITEKEARAQPHCNEVQRLLMTAPDTCHMAHQAARVLPMMMRLMQSPPYRYSPFTNRKATWENNVMTALPLSIGKIHFTGIGGIGMSGIAEILADLGYQVQGSDIAENTNVKRLQEKGITVSIPQSASNIDDVSIVVISTAIQEDNVELQAARARFIPVVHRAEMLGELMRLRWSVAVAGTHGKTTTTSLVATLFDAAQIDPTVINGGIIQSWGSNAKLGDSKWMVVEADESDGSFSRLKPTAAIVTNIDPEHLDHHGSYDNLELAFENFVASIPFYGFASLCIDHPAVQRLCRKSEIDALSLWAVCDGRCTGCEYQKQS